MKANIYSLIAILLISYACQGGQRGILQQLPQMPGQLPQFELFMQLPPEKQSEIFDFYLGDTIKQIYKNLSVWNQVNRYFKKFAQQGAGSNVIDRKINNILNSIGRQAYALNADFSQLKYRLNPLKDEKLKYILQQAKLTPYYGYQELIKILNDALINIAGEANTVSLMKLLIINGANINFTQGPVSSITDALDNAIKKSVLRMRYMGQQFKVTNELENLKFLLEQEIDPDRLDVDNQTHLEFICNTYLEFLKKNIHFLNTALDYLLSAADLLLAHKARITTEALKTAKRVNVEYNRPELYDLINKYKMQRVVSKGVEVTY